MGRHLTGSLILGILIAGSGAAQVYRDSYGRPGGTRYGSNSQRGYDPVGQTLDDLRNARSYRYADDHERGHFERTERELIRFQERWSRGRFDAGRLDSAIDNLKDLVRADQVHPRDRQMLARDLAQLRAFRNAGARYRDSYR